MVLLAGLGSTIPAYAQLDANLGGLTEGNAYGYLQPLPTGLSTTLNSAVFKTGHVPLVGLNFTVGVVYMTAKFDDDDRTYLPTAPTGFQSAESKRVPTVIGDTEAMAVHGQGGTILYYPGGFDLEYFAIAAPQLTVGSVLGTRAVVRFVSFDTGNADVGEVKLFGIGAQHSISRYFKEWPVDVAAGVFYQTFKIGDIIETNALQLSITGSRAFGMLEPYAGLGYDSFDMDAEYTYESSGIEEEIKVDFDRESNLHLTLGVGFNLSFVRLNAEYNIAAASGLALGLGFGI